MAVEVQNMDLDFSKSELLPAVIQDHSTGRVLMLGFMNEEAFRKTTIQELVSPVKKEAKACQFPVMAQPNGHYKFVQKTS